jgi:hypothetical protein
MKKRDTAKKRQKNVSADACAVLGGGLVATEWGGRFERSASAQLLIGTLAAMLRRQTPLLLPGSPCALSTQPRADVVLLPHPAVVFSSCSSSCVAPLTATTTPEEGQ